MFSLEMHRYRHTNVISITNDGSLYTTGEALGITGGGRLISINIDDVGGGYITQIFIDSVGSGYEIGDDASFYKILIQVVVLSGKSFTCKWWYCC